MLMIFSADAREYLFSPSSLEGDMLTQQDIDLSLFTKSNAQLPGTYSSVITINDRRLKDANIRYVSRSDGRLIPQLSPAMLRAWGINIDRYPPLLKRPAEETLPESLDNYIPQASAELDFSTMTLRLSIPQAALADNGRD
ncbi:FimD/PapC N-terminal domain-containing protein, partial [Enterobacter kobei]